MIFSIGNDERILGPNRRFYQASEVREVSREEFERLLAAAGEVDVDVSFDRAGCR